MKQYKTPSEAFGALIGYVVVLFVSAWVLQISINSVIDGADLAFWPALGIIWVLKVVNFSPGD